MAEISEDKKKIKSILWDVEELPKVKFEISKEGDAEGSTDEDDDQNFIRKDEPQEEKAEEKSEEQEEELGFFAKLKNKIFPNANKNRNLDKEVGGMEAEEQKESDAKDVWDNRSEEVDKMGSTDTFNSTGIRSVVWKQKKARLDAKKIAATAVDAHEAHKIMKEAKGIGTSSFDNKSFTQKIKAMREDKTNAFGNDKGGGRW